jgi:hypothetical protein
MSYNQNTNSIHPNAEQVQDSADWKVKGIKNNQGFEHHFKTREEAQGFIKGFVFAFQRNLV